MMYARTQQQSGFALLLTLVIVSVVLAIGLTLLDITIKQLTISGTNRDSEIAFHAAYAGAECAEYWRKQIYNADLTPDFSWCMGNRISRTAGTVPGYTDVYLTQHRYEWIVDGDARCTEMDLYIFDASSGQVLYDIQEYEKGVQEECSNGNICTFLLSRGYNRGCNNLNSLQTIQREVKLEF